MSTLSKVGICMMVFALLPYLAAGLAEALGAGPQTPCGQVVIFVVLFPVGALLWLVGLLVRDGGGDQND